MPGYVCSMVLTEVVQDTKLTHSKFTFVQPQAHGMHPGKCQSNRLNVKKWGMVKKMTDFALRRAQCAVGQGMQHYYE